MTSRIFGPVPSRRLGRSLGVDLVPYKTCTYDCIYCQLGPTTCKTVERKEWVPLDEVIAELEEKLAGNPDYVTLSGSGEPTLFSRLDELIGRIKSITDVPVAVLTNGSLLWREDVRRQLRDADLVIPSLDAGDQKMFELVNRPHVGIPFGLMLEGLIDFRREFRGEYWLEVFAVGDRDTDMAAELARVAKHVARIKPNRVQLNTITRPAAEEYAVGAAAEELPKLAAIFNPPAEVIAEFRGVHQESEFVAGRNEVLDLLRRRPCSIDDIAGGLDMHLNEVVKYVEELAAENLLEKTLVSGKLYYKASAEPN